MMRMVKTLLGLNKASNRELFDDKTEAVSAHAYIIEF
jgi:hypothetical protein